MWYYLNSIYIKNESDFEKIENLYHESFYKEYEREKPKASNKLFETTKIKFFPLKENQGFCIFDEDNIAVEEAAKELSKKIENEVISIQVFDSDEINVKAFRKGNVIAELSKNHKTYKTTGNRLEMFNSGSIDKEMIDSILMEKYTFMEDCAEKLFPQDVIFPEKLIAGQKVVRYYKEINLPLETEKLPMFQMYGWISPTQPNHTEFSIHIKNYGKKSEGIFVVLEGSAINNKNIKIKKAYFSVGQSTESIECIDYETKEEDGNTRLIFRFNEVIFPAGYNKETISKLYQTTNMTLYRKLLELEMDQIIIISFDYELKNYSDELIIYVYPKENLNNGYAIFKNEMGEKKF